MVLLSCENISFHYSREVDFHLEDISIMIEKGKITSLIGPNGSGKSTLFNCLTGENTIDKGKIFFKNQPIQSYSLKEKAKQIAIVYQSYYSRILLTVEEVVSMGRTPYKKSFGGLSKADIDYINYAIDIVNINHLRNRRLVELSGGQRQLVWLAVALAQEPELILLDEPTAYLDVQNQINFLNIIKMLNEKQGLTVCMILHDLNQVIKYSDYTYLLEKGKLIKNGKPEEVLTEETIKEVYSVDSERLINSNQNYVLDLF